MDVARILVLLEETEPKEIRLMVSGRPIEFDYHTVDEFSRGQVPLSGYAAVMAPAECAGADLLDAVRKEHQGGPMAFFFRGDPPLREAARWVSWAGPEAGEDGEEGEGEGLTNRLLTENLEYYSLASLYQQCLKIMTSQEEEKVLAQITDTFSHELGAESCVIWFVSPTDPDEMMIASVRGVISIDKEGSRFYLSQSEAAESILKGHPFHWIGWSEEKGKKEGGGPLYVPLLYHDKPIGLVKLGERLDRKPYSAKDIYVSRIIADYAATSLKMVERLFRTEKISLRDSETKAYSAAFLEDYFQKERYKAGRFRRPLSLVFLVIENLSYVMERTRESLVIGALGGMVEAIRKALRDSDLIARIDQNRFCVVLPETDAFGAMLAIRRLRKAVREKIRIHYLGSDFEFQCYFTAASYPQDGREFQDLLKMSEEKYGRLQKSPLNRLRLVEKDFWGAVDALVGKPEYYDMAKRGEEVPYFTRVRRDLGRNSHFLHSRETFLRLVEAVAQDVAANPKERGVVITAGPTPEIYKQIFLSYGADHSEGRKIYILGQAGSTRFDARNLLYVTADDEHMKEREVLMSLKEGSGYALFGLNRPEDVCGFNTSDEWLVEAMIEKVQDLYLLQGSF